VSGVKYPGHTEIFTALTGAKRSCMMLYSDRLTVSMVTAHIGYSEVPKKLSIRRVLDVIELTAEAMGWLLRRKPRLAVCGLNPHAGEHGLFGQKEEERLSCRRWRRPKSPASRLKGRCRRTRRSRRDSGKIRRAGHALPRSGTYPIQDAGV